MSQTQPQIFLAGLSDLALASAVAERLGERATVRLFDDVSKAADETARAVSSGQNGPSAVVLQGKGAASAARQIQIASSSTQLVIVAAWEDRTQLQRELLLSNVRRGWIFAQPDETSLVTMIQSAAELTSQQRQVRTTLDQTAVRLRADSLDAQKVRSLAISDAVLSAVLVNAVDAIIVSDPRGRVITANPAAVRLSGREEQALRSMLIGELIPGLRDPQEFAGRMSHHHLSCAARDTVPIDVTVSEVIVGGSPAGFAVVARDARERIAAEADLRRQAELTATIVNGIGEGVYVIDAVGNLLFMNPAAEELLGWSREELAQRNIHETIHSRRHDGGTVPIAECPLLLAIRSGATLRTPDEVFVRKDGSLVPVECTVTPVRAGEEVIGGVFNFHDISQQRALMEQLREEKDSLAQINRAKDDFLATISHELRTPVTSILGWMQLVTRGELDPSEMSEALEAIETSARNQAQIIGDLLDVSRVISGKLHLDISMVDMNEVVAAAIATLRPSADARDVQLQSSTADEPLIVRGDATRLQQVIWNLASNAIKFTPEGGVVRLLVGRHGDRVRVVCSDTGAGIPPEIIPRLFDQYHQAAGSARKGGLGLGLAIVRNLVDHHGGKVWLQSEGAGRGTTATVELPLAAVTVPASAT